MKRSGEVRMLSNTALSGFCAQIALMLDAGLSLSDGLAAMAVNDDSPDAALYRVLSERVAETGQLSEALKESGRFPADLAEIVRAGEEAGNLEEIMRRLSPYYERRARVAEATAHAVSYPIVLGAMLSLVVLVVLWKVVPVFRRAMNGMGVSADDSAGRLMERGVALGWIALGLIALALAAAALCLMLMRTSRRGRVRAALRRWIRPLGRIRRELDAARLAEILGLAASGGFSMESALALTAVAMDDEGGDVGRIREAVGQGAELPDALSASGLYAPMHCQMLRLSLQTGREAEVLDKLSEIYQKRAESDIEGLISAVEPALVAVLTVVVGAILISVMLPMLGILRSLM